MGERSGVLEVRAIDADAVLDIINNENYADWQTYSDIFDVIDQAPTVYAEPIVRCKDCAFVDSLECPINYIDHQRLIFTNRAPDWFCAEGRRKDDQQET